MMNWEMNFIPLLLSNTIISRNLINRVRITGESLWCDDVNIPKE